MSNKPFTKIDAVMHLCERIRHFEDKIERDYQRVEILTEKLRYVLDQDASYDYSYIRLMGLEIARKQYTIHIHEQ